MNRGERANEVVELIAAVAESLRADDTAGALICRSLARVTQGEAAAWIAVREGLDPLVIGSFPDDEAASLILAELHREGLPAASGQAQVRQAPGVGQFLVLAPEQLPGSPASGTRRIVAVTRRRGFDEEDLSFAEELLPALRLMLAQVVASSERFLRVQLRRESAREFGLTERELEVLQLLSHGLLATSMAARLELSPRTVHKHLGNIYEKMGVHDRLVAVSLARERGLVDAV